MAMMFRLPALLVVATATEAPSCNDSTTLGIERPEHRMPPAQWQTRPTSGKKGPLTDEEINRFYEDGFLVLPKFYDEDALRAVENDVSAQIDAFANRLHHAGLIKDAHANLDWTQRMLQIAKERPDAPIYFIKKGILPAALQRMFSNSRALDIAEQLGVGPGVALNPAWNLRAKMPSHEETVVPWHQDNSYWEPRIWEEEVLTFWVSLVDASKENGCMQFIRGGHKTGKTANHTIAPRTWYTELTEEQAAKELFEDASSLEVVTVPVPAGSVIIFPGTLPHRSLNSVSESIRWSADFRLHPSQPKRQSTKGGNLDWFYGLKDSLLLRDPANPDHVPEWDVFANTERTHIQDEAVEAPVDLEGQEFDPVIVGPWMDLWSIPNATGNRHTTRYLALPSEKRDIGLYMEDGHW